MCKPTLFNYVDWMWLCIKPILHYCYQISSITIMIEIPNKMLTSTELKFYGKKGNILLFKFCRLLVEAIG